MDYLALKTNKTIFDVMVEQVSHATIKHNLLYLLV